MVSKNICKLRHKLKIPKIYPNSPGNDKINLDISISHAHLNCICCTLRSGLHAIQTMNKTFPHGLEKNHACKLTYDNFPGMLVLMYYPGKLSEN